MASNVTIPVSNVVNVSISGAGLNLAVPNINTLALISSETPVNASLVGSYGLYQNASAVGTDWGIASKAFAIATEVFAQNPNILSSGGYLVIIPRAVGTQASLIVQDITYYAAAVGTAGNSITIAYVAGGTAGKEVVTVTSNAISVSMATGASTAQQIFNAISASPQAMALIYPILSGTATNTQTSAGATNLTSGSASGTESIIGAIVRTINTVFFYGLLIDQNLDASSATFNQLAAYVQGLTKVWFYSATVSTTLFTGGLLQLSTAAGNTRTRNLYYSDGTQNDTYAFAGGYAGRALSTNYNAARSVQTMNLKQIQGLSPDATITPVILATALANGVDVYPAIGSPNNGYIQCSGANTFWDQIYGQDWFVLTIQTAIFNALASVSNKIPQTEEGMTYLKGVAAGVCNQAVQNGWVAPGSWTAAVPFGNPADLARCIGDYGFYIYSQPITQQSVAQRVARVAPTMQIALKMAGAIHTVVVNVLVNL